MKNNLKGETYVKPRHKNYVDFEVYGDYALFSDVLIPLKISSNLISHIPQISIIRQIIFPIIISYRAHPLTITLDAVHYTTFFNMPDDGWFRVDRFQNTF